MTASTAQTAEGGGAAAERARVVEADGVFIVMSTYNGARYVEEQIRSIQRQSFAAWTLLVRDDGSTDDTSLRVAQLASADARVHLLPADGRNLRAPGSFGVLLETARAAGAQYVFLADQDDVWLSGKLDTLLAAMIALEAEHGVATPLLVHSDLEVVGEDLALINPSFVGYQRLPDRRAWEFAGLLVQNVVTGCAALANRALLDVAVPFPDVAMHDWWLAQCAAAAGVVRLVPAVTVRYRQHGRNVVGARSARAIVASALGSPRTWWQGGYRNFVSGLAQLRVLDERLRTQATPAAASAAVLTDAYRRALGVPATGRRVRAVTRLGVGPRSRLLYVLFLARVAVYRPR